MSQLVKKLTITALAVFMLLSMSAFAQNDSNLSLMAKADKASRPAKAAAAPAQHAATKSSQNWMTHRFEISFQGGGVAGGNLGQPQNGRCISAATNGADGCDANLLLSHNVTGTVGLYPEAMSGLRNFQRFGSVRPGNGGVLGLRLGFNVTPKWQLEFVYNHATTGTSFTNLNVANSALISYQSHGFPGDGPHNETFINGFDGTPHGDQNMYLFNLNRTFNQGGRVVPYLGAGVGAESWYAGPKFNLLSVNGSPSTAQFSKFSGSATGFAWDVAAGAKVYLTPNFGVRGDVMNVMSYPEFTNISRSTEIGGDVFGTPGLQVPISANFKQSGRFNQTLFTGGVFWAFGGGWNNPPSGAGNFASDDFWDHWELSFNFGGVHGIRNGHNASTCTPNVSGGCDFTATLAHGFLNGGVEPGLIEPSFNHFMTSGTLNPGDGWTSGLRLSYALTPKWELALTWNVTGGSTSLSNKAELDSAQQAMNAGSVGIDPNRTWDYLNGRDGTARGNQSMYLFNVNRTFHVSRRFVPYFGAGLGWEAWNNNPAVHVRTSTPDSNLPNVADFTRNTKNQMAFALDFAGGGKFYLSRRFGVRFDVMDVYSFTDFRTDFASFDTSGQYGTPGAIVPLSGRLKQDNHLQQIVSTAGIFYSFGQGGTWQHSDPNAPGTGAHAGRFELSFQVGGIVAGNLGEREHLNCASITSDGRDGCDINQSLKIDSGNADGIYPGALGGLRTFLRNGGVTPGNGGGLYGFRLGFNLSPAWQLEFVWNHSQTQTSFTDDSSVAGELGSFQAASRCGGSCNVGKRGSFVGEDDGSPRGDQNMWLVNLNRNFNVAGRVVPYVGAGYRRRILVRDSQIQPADTAPEPGVDEAAITKYSRGDTGFAFDLQTGVKVYMTNSFGLRADFTDVMSFPNFSQTVQTDDISGFLGTPGALVPISGRLSQDARLNQAIFSAGVFWTLGGRMDAKGYAQPQGDRDSKDDRWELSFNYGGVHGATWGPAATSCSEVVTGSCDPGSILSHNAGTSPIPGHVLATMPDFLANGGIKPGDGWTSGMQIGFNLNPDWQLSFIYNHLGTGSRFVNKALLEESQASFFTGCDCNTPRGFDFLNGFNGDAKGNQNQYLVNLNRNFRSNKRLVPYVGAGLGAESWFNNPHAVAVVVTSQGGVSGGAPGVTVFAKQFPGATGFAFDVAGGLKYYVGRHWGIRADMLNVTSFQEFTGRSLTIDASGTLGTPGAITQVSTRLKQSTRFNQTSGTGGIFLTF